MSEVEEVEVYREAMRLEVRNTGESYVCHLSPAFWPVFWRGQVVQSDPQGSSSESASG